MLGKHSSIDDFIMRILWLILKLNLFFITLTHICFCTIYVHSIQSTNGLTSVYFHFYDGISTYTSNTMQYVDCVPITQITKNILTSFKILYCVYK